MVYNMPPDTGEREKIVGGVMDITQLAWLAAGFGLYVIHALIMFRFVNWICLVVGIVFLVWGCIFAFKKKDDMPYPRYLRYKFLFKTRTRHFVNAGFHEELEFSDKI